ncbi:hypothetical protein ABTF44_08050 [Acinetobacter baumannii]|uniref:hypothetical protein n=1 Tax=Acinetobacter baumannii TaxID=470 RepID=UPI000448C137|nr:hypothetical protein [Acinetobacter baumannii]EXA60605.1 hypothetical protein J521_2793 [Acinetobacter baumannii 1035119]MBF9160834.1 hypothetical protein [Acinetobacter baumannii]MBR9724563.1 hypothetical protein [Acinetobacter baumannii]MCE6791348.1 hypothetical protein [Acinetobacter baumannii]MCG5780448.1 hypothetical protein [Acinetobacter baumannii]
MTIINKLNESLFEYEKLYDETPELLFVDLQVYEEILKSSHMVKLSQPTNENPLTFNGCELIPVERMQSEFKYLSHKDLASAIKQFNIMPTDLIVIRKAENTNRKEAANARRLGNEMMYKHFYIDSSIVKAYQRHYENKDLEF